MVRQKSVFEFVVVVVYVDVNVDAHVTTRPLPPGPAALLCLLLLACPSSAPAQPAAVRPVVAIVIDDVGESVDQLQPFLSIPLPLSFSVLPTTDRPAEVAGHLARLGRDVLVHLPMEPAEPDQMAGPGFLTTAMDAPTLRAVLARLLERVPSAVGANNHMGSRFTRDAARMEVVLAAMRERGLFFLDSRTDPGTVGGAVAAKVGLPFMERDVFLDNDPGEQEVLARLSDLAATARAKGCAVAIGHPRAATASALARFARDPARDVDLVPASRLPAPCRRPGP